MKETNTYFVKYKDRSGFTTCEEIEALNEDQAVKMVQMELIRENNYMSELRSVEEVEDQEDGKWSIEGGPELDQEDQDTLNDAMDSMFNEDGESLRESMEKIKDKE